MCPFSPWAAFAIGVAVPVVPYVVVLVCVAVSRAWARFAG